MFKKLALATSFALAAAMPQAVQAQTTMCNGGNNGGGWSGTFCAGGVVGASGTTVTFDLWVADISANTLPNVRITNVGLFAMSAFSQSYTFSNMAVAGVSFKRLVNGVYDANFSNQNLTSEWQTPAQGNNLAGGNGPASFLSTASATGSNDGIVGLQATGAIGNGSYEATGSSSHFVRFTFTTDKAMTSGDLQKLGFGYFAQGGGVSLRCFTGMTGDYNCGGPGTFSTVPEPSTYALMTAGLLGIFGVARRRRNAKV